MSAFIHIKRNEAWARSISKRFVSSVLQSKLHPLQQGDRASKAPSHQQVQQILLKTNSILRFQPGKQHWMFGATSLLRECADFGVWVCRTAICIGPISAAERKTRLKRGEVCFAFEVSGAFFINFSRWSSHHFWKGKARFLHQRTQQSDWHIYDFSLQLY